MSREHYRIFSPASIAGLEIKNRMVRSATAEGGATEEGTLAPGMLDLYKNLAAGGVGLIITGHMAVQASGRAGHNQTAIWDDRFIPEIAKIAAQAHQAAPDCKIVGQLSHAGRQVLRNNTSSEPVGPSDVPSPLLEKRARPLSTEEVETVIDAFASGIERVQKAGFDGAQIHAAHGWLLSSFISPYTNRRTDAYGGSLEKRCAIIREIVARARQKVGDFPILIKINCDDQVEGGHALADFPAVARAIEDAGVDAMEISGGMWDCLVRSEEELGFTPVPIPEARTRINQPEKQSYFAPYIEKLETKVPVILVGGNKNVELLEAILKAGHADFVSFSRPFISEPDLPNRWLQGRGSEKTDCISCNACLISMSMGITTCFYKNDKEKYKMVQQFLTTDAWKDVFK